MGGAAIGTSAVGSDKDLGPGAGAGLNREQAENANSRNKVNRNKIGNLGVVGRELGM